MSGVVWWVVCGGVLAAYGLGAWLGYTMGYRKAKFEDAWERRIR